MMAAPHSKRLTFTQRMKLAEMLNKDAERSEDGDGVSFIAYDDQTKFRAQYAHALGMDTDRLSMAAIKSTAEAVGIQLRYSGVRGQAAINQQLGSQNLVIKALGERIEAVERIIETDMAALENRITKLEAATRASVDVSPLVDKFNKGKR